MKRTKVWTHERLIFKQKGRKDLVVEGMHEKGAFSLMSFEMRMKPAENGWKLKKEESWETVQEYWIPDISHQLTG